MPEVNRQRKFHGIRGSSYRSLQTCSKRLENHPSCVQGSPGLSLLFEADAHRLEMKEMSVLHHEGPEFINAFKKIYLCWWACLLQSHTYFWIFRLRSGFPHFALTSVQLSWDVLPRYLPSPGRSSHGRRIAPSHQNLPYQHRGAPSHRRRGAHAPRPRLLMTACLSIPTT